MPAPIETPAPTPAPVCHRPAVGAPAFWLGFALAGFFDGILLHQVLQWHHLLSNLSGEGFGDIRLQIAADGYFHVLMYVLLAFAIWLIWKRRSHLAGSDAGVRFVRFLLFGFGAWQVVDVGLFHWVLGIHNIRVGVENPVLWDVGWLVVFGIAPLVLAAAIRGNISGGGRGATLAASCIALTVLAGVWAARPASAAIQASTIVFAPWINQADAFAATAARSTGLLWAEPSSGVYVVTGISDRTALELYAQGAILITDRGFPPGCFGAFSGAQIISALAP